MSHVRSANKMPNRATHWCYACRRPIRVSGQDITCPNCNDGFIQEISEIGGSLNTYGIFDPSFDERRDRSFGMVEAMSDLMRQRMAEMGRNRVLDFHGTRGASSHQGRQPTVRPMLIFGSNAPDRHNSCPVCRHPLPSSSHRSGSTRSSSTHSNEAVSHGVARSDADPVPVPVARSDDSRNHEMHGSFSFLWPFDSPTPDSSSYTHEGGVGEPTVHDDTGQMTYSEWHYDY
ncbi:hypothetical protein OsI_04103 [Oryza sativa Indica Group]|uniref:RING-type E3 ubiquitin transferase n=1 Tax=Oryza sativa subsp. indica TaxID=39946 RepID=A2WW25_ORYSI|nr:hypothetical protein OsI_04103 [Oryza sativa Indica Group]